MYIYVIYFEMHLYGQHKQVLSLMYICIPYHVQIGGVIVWGVRIWGLLFGVHSGNPDTV